MQSGPIALRYSFVCEEFHLTRDGTCLSVSSVLSPNVSIDPRDRAVSHYDSSFHGPVSKSACVSACILHLLSLQ